MTKEITKLLKKELANVYGFKNVSVTKGSGTAFGWVDVRIKVETNCEDLRCEVCRIMQCGIAKEAKEICYKAMEKNEMKFYTYTSDDGFDTERDCFLLQVDLLELNN